MNNKDENEDYVDIYDSYNKIEDSWIRRIGSPNGRILFKVKMSDYMQNNLKYKVNSEGKFEEVIDNK